MESDFERHLEASENLGLAGSALIFELLERQMPKSLLDDQLDFDFGYFCELAQSSSRLNPKQTQMILNVLRDLLGDHLKLQTHLAGRSKVDILNEIYQKIFGAEAEEIGENEAKKVYFLPFAGAICVIISDLDLYSHFFGDPKQAKQSLGFFRYENLDPDFSLAGRCIFMQIPNFCKKYFFRHIKNLLWHEYFHFLYHNYLQKHELPAAQKSPVLASALQTSTRVADQTKFEKCYFRNPELQSLFWEFRNELCAYSIGGEIQVKETTLQNSSDFYTRIIKISGKEKNIFLTQWRALKLVLIECQDKKINPRILLPCFLASQSFDEMRIKIQKVLDAH